LRLWTPTIFGYRFMSQTASFLSSYCKLVVVVIILHKISPLYARTNFFYRTVLNQMVSLVCPFCIAYNLVGHCTDLIRYSYGPFGTEICWMVLFGKNTIHYAIELCMVVHIIFKVSIIFCVQIKQLNRKISS
jgi:ERCC4-type nuclease